MDITVILSAAIICFQQQCYPALVGKDTPIGEFSVIQRLTEDPGYGGDVLQFHETDKRVYAIHRVWTLNPKQKRLERLQSSNVKERQTITSGCINVMPEIYDRLVDCCANGSLIIKK